MNSATSTGQVIPLDSWRGAKSAATSRVPGSGLPTTESANSVFLAAPAWEPLVNQRITALSTLEQGWDGFDAKPIDPFIWSFGVRLLHAVLPSDATPPDVSPLCYGGVQFEWFLENFQLEVEIESQYRVRTWFRDLLTQQEGEHTFDYNYTDLAKLMENIVCDSQDAANAATAA